MSHVETFEELWEFEELLQSLATHPASAHVAKRAADVALRRDAPAIAVVSALRDHLARSTSDQMGSLSLLDALCRKAAKKQPAGDLFALVQEEIFALWQPIFAAASVTRRLYAEVQKTLQRWRELKIFADDIMEGLAERFAAIEPPSATATEDEELTETERLHRIDADREEQKRQREESALRPVGEDPEFGEFEERWAASENLDIDRELALIPLLMNASSSATAANGRSSSSLVSIAVPVPVQTPAVHSQVFVWDLDETLIIFQSLQKGDFAKKYGKSEETAASLADRISKSILKVLDSLFFFRDLDETTPGHIGEMSANDDNIPLDNYDFSSDELSRSGAARVSPDVRNRLIAYRYRHLRKLYSTPNLLEDKLSPGEYQRWESLLEEVNAYTDNWVRLSYVTLERFSQYGYTNVLVSNGHLAALLAKLHMFHLHHFFSIENIYSSQRNGKEWCFQTIRDRFGSGVQYFAVGDGEEEFRAAKKSGWAFLRISSLASLQQLFEGRFLCE